VPADGDIREGLDAVQADMAAHQQRFSGEVTAEDNRALASTEFERLERQWADSAKRIQPAPPEAEEPSPTVEHREIDGAKYTISSSPVDDVEFRQPTPAEVWFMAHAWPRVELLITKVETGPLGQASWSDRMLAVMAQKLKAVEARQAARAALDAGDYSRASTFSDLGNELDRRYVVEFEAILDASSAVFGDWRKDAPTKVIVG
jgi:hypothetical protein